MDVGRGRTRETRSSIRSEELYVPGLRLGSARSAYGLREGWNRKSAVASDDDAQRDANGWQRLVRGTEHSIRATREGSALTALSYGRLSVHHTPWTGDESTCASRPVPRQTRTSTPSAWRGSLAPLLFSRARICFTNSVTGSEAHGRCMKPHRPLIAGRIVPQLVMEGLARRAVGWSDPGQSKKCTAS
jgi:hypothetical protein